MRAADGERAPARREHQINVDEISQASRDDDLIGVTTSKAARIVGASIKNIAAWDANALVQPSVHRQYGGRHIRVYSLPDLVELAVVQQLREHGVTIPRIRRLVE